MKRQQHAYVAWVKSIIVRNSTTPRVFSWWRFCGFMFRLHWAAFGFILLVLSFATWGAVALAYGQLLLNNLLGFGVFYIATPPLVLWVVRYLPNQYRGIRLGRVGVARILTMDNPKDVHAFHVTWEVVVNGIAGTERFRIAEHWIRQVKVGNRFVVLVHPQQHRVLMIVERGTRL